MKLKCFVACAFGKKDVDDFYTKVLSPLLKGMNILPLRVDKINHNKNIDQKIIELIKISDFGIADLTYARPSVYYESGFIHGMNKDVIFTVRKDHFKPKMDDEDGIYRIHFDLITKNIIPWYDLNKSLKEKIKKRVGLISKPLLEERTKKNFEDKSKSLFARSSISNRLKIIAEISHKHLNRKGFSLIEKTGNIHTYTNKNNNKFFINLFANKFTTQTIKYFTYYIYPNWFDMHLNTFYKYNHIILMFNSLSKINEMTIHSTLPDFTRDEKSKIYTNFRSSDNKLFEYIFMDGFNSIEEYKISLKHLV